MDKAVSKMLTKYYHCNLNGLMFITARLFKTCQHESSEKKLNLDPSKIVKRDGTVVRKRTEEKKLITVVYNSKENVWSMTEALKFAKSKRLHLIKIEKPSPKSMDFYKLSKALEVKSVQSDKNKRKMKKFTFKTTTAEHDMLYRVNFLIKALYKYNICCYIVENHTKDPCKIDELSRRIQNAISKDGINFTINDVHGNNCVKTFIVEMKEEDDSGGVVATLPKDEGSEPSSEGISEKS